MVVVLLVVGRLLEAVESVEVAFMVAGAAAGATAPSVALNLHLPFDLVDHDVTENCLPRDLRYQVMAIIVPMQSASEDLVGVDATYHCYLGEQKEVGL